MISAAMAITRSSRLMQNILKGFLNSSIVYSLAAPRPVEEYETSQLLSLRSIACFPLELIILPSSVIEYVPGSSFNLNVEQVSFFLFKFLSPSSYENILQNIFIKIE